MRKESVDPDAAVRRGWLNENYRLFSINSLEKERIPSHFHTFHKLILLRSGQLSYLVEGTLCTVLPGDLLLVPAYSVHQPLIGPEPYDRIVLWIRPEAPEAAGADRAFLLADMEKDYLCSCPEAAERIRRMAEELTSGSESALPRETTEKAEREAGTEKNGPAELPEPGRGKAEEGKERYGRERLCSALLTEALVLLGRKEKKDRESQAGKTAEKKQGGRTRGCRQDDLVTELLTYISAHLEEPLTAEELARRFYISESRLTHRFRKAAGCTLHQFVLQKRLARAAGLLKQGMTAAEAAQQSGFTDYSTFYRAFRKAFGTAPADLAAG